LPIFRLLDPSTIDHDTSNALLINHFSFYSRYDFQHSTPIPTPTVTTPTLRPDIETLLKTLMTQELSSVDREVLTTELERLLDELTEGQSQISVEYEDDNEEEKALTITITPIDLNAPVEEEAETEEDNDNGDNGDNGDDEPPEEPTPPIDIPAPPF
jgi:hypothetical protein